MAGPAQEREDGLRAPRGAAALIAAGLVLLGLALGGTLGRWEPFYTGVYVLAWGGYILLLDGLNARRAGHSLILSRTREFLLLLPASAVVWYVFELLNVRLRNWYYIQIPVWSVPRWIGTGAAFATVLPLLFETVEWLDHRRFAAGVRWPRLAVDPGRLAACRAVGWLSLAAVLVAPRVCFPLVWGIFLFLLEPTLYRQGGRSLLRDLEAGRPARLLQLLTAGLITGGLWELFNHGAHSKWVYTVPWFEGAKLFEMPLLGFLGFPPFAAMCYVMYNAVCLLRSGRTWEHPGRWAIPPRSRGTARQCGLLAACGAIVWIAGQWSVDRVTIDSYYGVIRRHYPWIAEESWRLMAADRCLVPHQLHRRLERDGVGAVAHRYRLPADRAQAMADELTMVELKGMGFDNARILRRAGVTTLAGLALSDPDRLYRLLRDEHPRRWVPQPAKVRLWVAAAARTTATQRAQP